MSALLNYLVQVIAISGILYGYYHFALRNKRFHQYNRFYLLLSTVLSLVIPFLNIPVYFTDAEKETSFILETLSVIATSGGEEPIAGITTLQTTTTWFSLENILLLAYLAIGTAILVRVLISLIKIRAIIKNNPVEKLDDIRLVNTTEPNTPFSFFKWLFWNKEIELQSEKGKQIFRHELFHIKERHSWDVIFMELVTVVLWINPFFHLIKKEAKTIHEFLADRFAMKDTQNWQYAELLLMQAFNTNQHLINPFFHNQIKRRIAMITTSKKPSYQYLRKMMLLPLATIAVMLFAFSYKSQKSEATLLDSKELFIVVIDAGHGGEDEGAKAADGTLEKDIVLAIAQKVKALNEDANIKIISTREDDVSPTLQERVGNTSKHKADLFLSLHISSTPKTPTTKSGFEIYISDKNKKFEIENMKLANIMLNNFEPLYTTNKNILKRKMSVFILDNAPCPSAIIECGYLNNPKDLAYIKDPVKQDEIANAILQSIKTFTFQSKETTFAINSVVTVDTTPKENTKDATHKRELTINGKTYPYDLTLVSENPYGKLVVLDGIKMTNAEGNAVLNKLEPNRIKTFSILKGPAAVYKYGEAGKNGVIEVTTKDKVNAVDTTINPSADNKIFEKVEIEPAFPGGEEKWKMYLMKNLNGNIPIENKAPINSYTVVVQFLVNTDGYLSDVKALTNHGYGLEEEAVRIIRKGPKWIPAIQNGKQANAVKKQPITFVINEETKKLNEVVITEVPIKQKVQRTVQNNILDEVVVIGYATKKSNTSSAEKTKGPEEPINEVALNGYNSKSNESDAGNIFPNPATNIVTIPLSSNIAGTALVQIIEASGKIALTQRPAINKGLNNLTINTRSLKAGIYVIKLTSTDGSGKSYKMIKQ